MPRFYLPEMYHTNITYGVQEKVTFLENCSWYKIRSACDCSGGPSHKHRIPHLPFACNVHQTPRIDPMNNPWRITTQPCSPPELGRNNRAMRSELKPVSKRLSLPLY